MTRFTFLVAFIMLLTACGSNTPEAIGEHNLSKGQCTNIPNHGQAVSDEMTQDVCRMVGGTFVPRNHLKKVWF